MEVVSYTSTLDHSSSLAAMSSDATTSGTNDRDLLYWSSLKTIHYIEEEAGWSRRDMFEGEPRKWVEVWDGGRPLNVHHLVCSLALLACEKPGLENVTACTIEQVLLNGIPGPHPSYVIRLARNKAYDAFEISNFQKFVDSLISVVLETPGIISQDEMGTSIDSILELVARRCATKIGKLYSRPLQRWLDQLEAKGTSVRSAMKRITSRHDPELVSDICGSLLLITDSVEKKDLVVAAIKSARFMMQDDRGGDAEVKQLVKALEDHWQAFERREIASMVGSTVAPEDRHDEYEDVLDTSENRHDEYEDVFGISETKKSSIYRYLLRLSRYYVAASQVFRYLQQLRKRNQLREDTFKVATVYGFRVTSTAVQEHDYSTFGEFVGSFKASGVLFGQLSEKVQAINEKWAGDLHRVRYLHCELQLAIFYLLNPELVPMGDFIGVCQYSCKLCVEFLKTLAYLTPAKPCTAARFPVAGTNNKLVINWVLPQTSLLANHATQAGSLDTRHFQPCVDANCHCPSITSRQFRSMQERLVTIQRTVVQGLRLTIIKGMYCLDKNYDVPSGSGGLSYSGLEGEADSGSEAGDLSDEGLDYQTSPPSEVDDLSDSD